MNRILLLLVLFSATSLLNAQNFHYKSSMPFGVSINDAIELNGKYYLVGDIDSVGTQRPYFGILDNSGTLIFDSILNVTGSFVNIHEVNSTLSISSFFTFGTSLYNFFDFQFDTNFAAIPSSVVFGSEILSKSKLINDSTIIYIAQEPPGFINRFTAFVYLQNIPDSSVYANFSVSSNNPLQVYDIISPSPGIYHLFTNSPDSLFSDQVTVHYLNDSLLSYRSEQLTTSYNQFGSTSRIVGPVSAEVVNGSIIVNATADHPTYLNQVNTLDMALIRYDTNYNELSISFTGKTDTSYTTSINSLSVSQSQLFSGGNTISSNPNFDELVLNQHDVLGNVTKSVYYADGTKLKLKKLLQTPNDELLIIGNTGNQFFVIKADSLSGNLPTNLLESILNSTIDVAIFPNPTADWIKIDLKGEARLVQYYLYNLNGQILKTGINSNGMINISKFDNGVYFIMLETDLGIVTKKVIISK